MLDSLTDELVTKTTTGNVGQLTENEEDNDVSCVFAHLDCYSLAEGDVGSLFFTRSDLLKMLAQLEEANER